MTADIRTIAQPYPATPARHGLLASAYRVTDAIVSVNSIGPEVGIDAGAEAILESIKKSDPERYDQIMARWEIGGYSVTPENCVEIESWDPDCANWPAGSGPGDGDKTALSDSPENEETYHVAPFAVETGFKCDAKGFQVVDYRGRAERQLEAATPKAVEYEFWTGTLKPTNPHLDGGATVLGGATAFPANQALFLLGQYLANVGHGGIGMIHAPSFLVDEWLEDMGGSAISTTGDRLRTVNRGDIIVSGAGYPGTGPDGVPPADGETWVYATNVVTYRLGSPMITPNTMGEALNRSNNDIEYRAIRQAAVGFDPCRHAAVLVDTAFTSGIIGSL